MQHSTLISPAPHLRTRLGKVCVALSARTVPELLERAEATLADSQFLEFRLDSLDSLGQAAITLAPISVFLAEHKEVTAIATCRRKAHGGNFSGKLADELVALSAAAEAGFTLIDLSIESAEEASAGAFELLRETLDQSGTALLISFHDFQAAADPEAAFARIQRFQPDFIKIVNTALSLSDNLALLDWLKQRSGDAQVIGIAMGETGIVSRILGIRAGSAFTFASAPNGHETAPGQMTARTLRDLYRIDQIDQATKIYGVAGNPISHSLSPLMQNTAFRRERVNAVYLPLKAESGPAGVADLLNLFHKLPLSGLSVTMPLKLQLLPHLANVDPLTAKLGACNTIRLGADGKLYGFNTDVAGIIRPLEKRMTLKDRSILVLGAGGAARAAVYGLAEKGAKVFIWSRKESAAKELAASSNTRTITEQQIAANEFDVLINATPCGMTGNPHPLPLEGTPWKARVVFDLVYNPLDTPLLQAAKARGLHTIQGVEMFVHQGARQFELWTGKAAPEAEMLRVVLHALTNKAH
jgi:3-dehydroquinate dehydratase/shikimate dehydrogenase